MPRMRHAHDDADIIGSRPVRDQLADLPMFAPPPPTIPVEGAGQRARRIARAKAKVADGLLLVQAALERHPQGLTRSRIADETGLSINTVNGRVADLRALSRIVTRGTQTRIYQGREITESVVVLVAAGEG